MNCSHFSHRRVYYYGAFHWARCSFAWLDFVQKLFLCNCRSDFSFHLLENFLTKVTRRFEKKNCIYKAVAGAINTHN